MAKNANESGVLEPRFIDAKLDGSSWRPLNAMLKKFKKEPMETVQDVLLFIEKYTELYDLVETQTLIRGGRFIANQNAKNTLKLLGFALKVTLPAFLARKKVFKLIHDHPSFPELTQQGHPHLQRLINKEIEIKTSIMTIAREYLKVLSYSRRLSSLRADYAGMNISMYKLGSLLENPDRDVREEAWRKIYMTVLNESPKFNRIFDNLRAIREKTAKKNHFDNARDYYHASRGRFDYTPDDCFMFHDSVETVLVPFLKDIYEERRQKLCVDVLRPWDKRISLGKVLQPYDPNDPDDLIRKMIPAFTEIRDEYGHTLEFMHENGFIDHVNRKGKMSGAMSIPLMKHRCGFIIANTVGSERDVRTIAHEGGHSVHWAAASKLPIAMYKELLLFPMEVAEVGSMTMEFLILDHADKFFDDPEDVKRFKWNTVYDAIHSLPWQITIDAFQHWIYTHPDQTVDERMDQFGHLMERFDGACGIDYSGLDREKQAMWLMQSHVFQSPFYYIDYAIAQIAALGIYRNLKRNKEKALQQYHDFLELGNSLSLPELYNVAGIKFDFSKEYISGIVDFVREELEHTKIE